MKNMRFYKGDLIIRQLDNNNPVDNEIAVELRGVMKDTFLNPENVQLFRRPFKNKVKHLWYLLQRNV